MLIFMKMIYKCIRKGVPVERPYGQL